MRLFSRFNLPGVAILLAAFLGLLGNPAMLHAGGGPEGVLVVVNSASWASQAVANEFIRLRQIPPDNVFYINWDGGFEQIDIADFRQKILGPTINAIQMKGLSLQIDYVVYSSDFPYCVSLNSDLHGELPPLELSDRCSINSLTFLYQDVLASKPTKILNLHNNFYLRAAPGRDPEHSVHGFRGWYGWGPAGQLMEAGGQRYFLSTMLAITSGRGNSVPEALSYLRRSATADGKHPPGTIYFMQNDDVRSKTRASMFGKSAALLKQIGVQAAVLPGTIPLRRPDVQGAMMGVKQFKWKTSGSTILPGAICEHLTSYGGIMSEQQVGSEQTQLTELLRYGAAGASGTVVEPYANPEQPPTKFPLATVQVCYAYGCSLAESFYQAISGPFQLLIVGDPLCRPWANIPTVEAAGVETRDTLKGEIEITPSAEFAATEKVPGGDTEGNADRYELYVDGHITAGSNGEPFTLDTATMADGHHDLRVVAIEAGPIETQGRAIVPVQFNNHGRKIEFTASPDVIVRWDQKLLLKAKSPGSAAIVFLHNGRLLGKIVGEEGETEVNPRVFGTGPVTLRAVGLGREGPTDHVFAKPIELDVQPAPPLPALSRPTPTALKPGMMLKLADGKTVLIQQTLDPSWLATANAKPPQEPAGVKPGEAFELEGYFSVPIRQVYQFQIWHRGSLKLMVDETTLYQSAEGNYTQRFLPVALALGTHRLKVSGKAGEKVELRILFGGPGSLSLDGSTFKHVGK